MSVYDNLDIPEYFQSTFDMVVCAFPEGIPENYYFPLLKCLADSMSFRQAAAFMAPITREPEYAIYHYVVKSLDLPDDLPEVLEVLERLNNCGYAEWLEED